MIKYFDFNATTPLDPEIWKAMEPFAFQDFANPSSLYHAARGPARALRTARRQVASLLNLSNENDIVFTSGGTESNNAAIFSAVHSRLERREIITSTVEHSSVLKVCAQLETEGFKIHRIPVDENGGLDFEALERVLSNKVALASFMFANNETGVIFPIEEIARLLEPYKILLHVDAVQAAGKVALVLNELPVDFLSLSAHKFYGPKGVGALYIRSSASFKSLIYGGSQERGRRAGTENVPGIVGLGLACEKAQKNLNAEMERLAILKNNFEKRIQEEIPDTFINGTSLPRLCNTSSLGFEGIASEALLMLLDQKKIYVSSGSACMSGSNEPSHVLKAMGLSSEKAKSCLRFSFGKSTSLENVNGLIDELIRSVLILRQRQPELNLVAKND